MWILNISSSPLINFHNHCLLAITVPSPVCAEDQKRIYQTQQKQLLRGGNDLCECYSVNCLFMLCECFDPCLGSFLFVLGKFGISFFWSCCFRRRPFETTMSSSFILNLISQGATKDSLSICWAFSIFKYSFQYLTKKSKQNQQPF